MRSLRAYIDVVHGSGKHSYEIRELGRQSTQNQINPGINSMSEIRIDTVLNGVVVSKGTAGDKKFLFFVNIGLVENFSVPHPKNDAFYNTELNTKIRLRVKQVDAANNLLELEILP
jgi:hypothetical protein